MQAVPDGARLFELALQPEGLHQPWHAWLRDAEGHTHEFDAPIELLRHLLRLNDHNPPAGGLR